MNELMLLRHAKSSWSEATLDDFDRPLAPRGVKAAPLMGREMADRDWMPSLVVISPAARTRQTWSLVAGQWPAPPQCLAIDRLYMAEPEFILDLLRVQQARSILVVGHNPGMEQFAVQISGPESDAAASAALKAKYPTGALARFELHSPWSKLARGGARLTHFLRPPRRERGKD